MREATYNALLDCPDEHSQPGLDICQACVTKAIATAIEADRKAVAEQVAPILNNLLLDIYDLSVANGWIDPGEQRELAEVIARKVGRLREQLGIAG